MTQQQQTQTTEKGLPVAGEAYRCGKCGMELEITTSCHCEEGTPLLACCGQAMERT